MDLSKLGKPDLTISGLKVWVHGREYENSDDYWDGNWLRVTANCAEKGAFATTLKGNAISRARGSVSSSRPLVRLLRGRFRMPIHIPM